MQLMRKLILFLATACQMSISVYAQEHRPIPPLPDPRRNVDSLPYKLDPILPVFNILLRDSVEIFNTFNIPKGGPIALMLFSPDCHHCSEAMDALCKGMDSISNIRFYMISTSAIMSETRKFADEHQLDKYPNIKAIGWDYEFAYLTHFGTMHIPDVALYDGNKKFKYLFEAGIRVRDLYVLTH
jgi:hypothetical protein